MVALSDCCVLLYFCFFYDSFSLRNYEILNCTQKLPITVGILFDMENFFWNVNQIQFFFRDERMFMFIVAND